MKICELWWINKDFCDLFTDIFRVNWRAENDSHEKRWDIYFSKTTFHFRMSRFFEQNKYKILHHNSKKETTWRTKLNFKILLRKKNFIIEISNFILNALYKLLDKLVVGWLSKKCISFHYNVCSSVWCEDGSSN